MFEGIINFFKKFSKNEEESKSKDTAKERLHLVLMQDRANVSADFLDMMKQEIIEVIKKYIEVDEKEIDVKLTNKTNEDGSVGAPALYANIPISKIKNENKSNKLNEKEEIEIKKEKNVVNENDKANQNNKENKKNKKNIEVKENQKSVKNNEEDTEKDKKDETNENIIENEKKVINDMNDNHDVKETENGKTEKITSKYKKTTK